jgi:hypothetical protein
MTQTSNEKQLKLMAAKLRERAMQLPFGNKKDRLLKVARQLETSSHATAWVNSSGLRPPTDDSFNN